METVTVDIYEDGRIVLRDDAGRVAYMQNDEWVRIQREKLRLIAENGSKTALFWYAQTLINHIVTKNTTKK